jgi:hypothetical protein
MSGFKALLPFVRMAERSNLEFAFATVGIRLVAVAGTANIATYLEGGERAAQTVRELLAASERPVERCGAILDFGCGCGRRQWKDLAGTGVHGTDLNRELVEWCTRQLPFTPVSRSVGFTSSSGF